MQVKFNAKERAGIFGLTNLLLVRMMALFMIYPVFASNATEYNMGDSELLVGIAMGVYAFAQGVLQLPFGMLSDRYGRKRIIIIGLFMLLLGGLMAAVATSIYGVILGRAIQGAGAIGCVIHALVADTTREVIRARAMAVLGMAVGMAFFVGMIVGPVIHNYFAIKGIFWFSSLLAALGIAATLLFLPEDDNIKSTSLISWDDFKGLFSEDLVPCYLSIFSSHACFAALFMVLPNILQSLGYVDLSLWKLYIPILFISFLMSFGLIMMLERNKINVTPSKIAIYLIMFGQLSFLWYQRSQVFCIIGMLLFFIGFSFLEAYLPSKVSKLVEPVNKGSGLGLLSTHQFLGIFTGSFIAGSIKHSLGLGAVLIFGFVLSFAWLIIFSRFYMRKITSYSYR